MGLCAGLVPGDRPGEVARYRLLDPVKDKPPTDKTGAATAPAGALSEAGPAVDLRAEAGPKAGRLVPSHGGSVPCRLRPAGVYHDNSGCAYGKSSRQTVTANLASAAGAGATGAPSMLPSPAGRAIYADRATDEQGSEK